MSSQTTNFHFTLPATNEGYNVGVQNDNWQIAETALSMQSNRTTMMKITCASLQDMKDKMTTVFNNLAVETAIELVLVTTPAFDIFPNGTHSFTFHKLAGNYWWGYGFVNKKLAIISNAGGTWTTEKYGEVLLNTGDTYQHVFLERNGNLYHLHYVRKIPIANGSTVTSINSSYAPTANATGFDWFMQASGYSMVSCRVDTTGAISLWASTYDEPLAGVFDVYWEK